MEELSGVRAVEQDGKQKPLFGIAPYIRVTPKWGQRCSKLDSKRFIYTMYVGRSYWKHYEFWHQIRETLDWLSRAKLAMQEGVETERCPPKAASYGEETVQTTNRTLAAKAVVVSGVGKRRPLLVSAAFGRHGLSVADDGNYLSPDRKLECAEAVQNEIVEGVGTVGIPTRMEKGQDVVNTLHFGSPDPI